MKMQSINPATEEVMKEFDVLTYDACIRKLKESKEHFKKWRALDISERAKLIKKAASVLRKNKEKYGKLITIEMGKPITSAIAEIEKCAWLCDYYAENAGKFLRDQVVKTDAYRSYVTFEPLGTILCIMPWNFPFWQALRFAIPALCAGNVAVLKHSSNVPQCALAVEELFVKAGLGKAFQTLLIGSGTALELIDSKYIDAVSITGSTAAGRKVGETAGRNVKKSVLELGGSDPFIVLGDANINFTCETGVNARMLNTGQSCIAAKRFIVVEKIAKQFEKKFVEYTRALRIGDPMDKRTNVGPLARPDLVDNLERQIKDSVSKGAKILTGGHRPNMKGFYYEPTVLTNVRHGMAVLEEETFGPVAPIIVVKDEKAAIAEANKTGLGLGASIWTRDIKKAEKLAKDIEAGFVSINKIVRSDPRLPFGGIKESGYGRELSEYGIKEFVNIKSIVVERAKK